MTRALYHFGPSPYSARVRIALEEKGLAWESRIVRLTCGEHFQPWYLRINPKGLLPALADGETIVCESLEILRYLEERYPERRLLPAPGPERVEAEAWIERAQNLPLEQLHAALSNRLATAAERRAFPSMLGKLCRLATDNPDLAPVYAAKIAAFRASSRVRRGDAT